MTEYWAKCIVLETGMTVHVTGKWKNADSMAEALQKDGMVILTYGKCLRNNSKV